MAISTSSVGSANSVERIQYDAQPQTRQTASKTEVQKEQESPAPTYNSELNRPNDGTGATYSFLV